ncbi:MAG: 2-amino-4-hydroxy-6-hydroxymethyldihydropteridine diphosphokinase [Alphaproteobacteria bacterium]
MILIGIGANLPTVRYGPPRAGCEAALAELGACGVRVIRRSRWYESAPVPLSDQPWFVNGVAAVETARAPRALLEALQAVEVRFGRVRAEANGPRVIDLDLLAYDDRVIEEQGLSVPHPRLASRAFVLLPMREVAPFWRDPRSGRSLDELIADLPAGQVVRPLGEEPA